MTWKEHLFTFHGWVVTLVHDLILGGLLLFTIAFLVQWYGIEVAFQVPTIEATFKKK